MFKANVVKVGGKSLGITIPKPICEAMKIKKGSKVIIEIKKAK